MTVVAVAFNVALRCCEGLDVAVAEGEGASTPERAASSTSGSTPESAREPSDSTSPSSASTASGHAARNTPSRDGLDTGAVSVDGGVAVHKVLEFGQSGASTTAQGTADAAAVHRDV